MFARPASSALLLALSSAGATVTIDPGTTEVFLGTTTSVEIPITAVGGDAVTDLIATVSITGGPTITSVSYTGSVWESAPGGYIDFFPGFPPPPGGVRNRATGRAVTATRLRAM